MAAIGGFRSDLFFPKLQINENGGNSINLEVHETVYSKQACLGFLALHVHLVVVCKQ